MFAAGFYGITENKKCQRTLDTNLFNIRFYILLSLWYDKF